MPWIPVNSIEEILSIIEPDEEERFSLEVIEDFEFRTNSKGQLELLWEGKINETKAILAIEENTLIAAESDFRNTKHHSPSSIKQEIIRVIGINGQISTLQLLSHLGYKKNNDTFRKCIKELLETNQIEYICKKKNSKNQKLKLKANVPTSITTEVDVSKLKELFSYMAESPEWPKIKKTKRFNENYKRREQLFDNEKIQEILTKKSGYEPYNSEILQKKLSALGESKLASTMESIIKEKGLLKKDANKTLINKICSTKNVYIPERVSIYKIAMWYHLSWPDTERLLKAAGLYYREDYYIDVILSYYIQTNRTTKKYYEEINKKINEYEEANGLSLSTIMFDPD